MKIICYGASNTYGFDPRTYTGEPYARPWPSILSEKLGLEAVNLGWPGRKIPETEAEIRSSINSIRSISSNDDLIIIMLGTNDLLSGRTPEASILAMEKYLKALDGNTVLIGPPQIKGLETELAEMNQGFETLGVPWADSSTWNLEMAFDGIHMSEKDQYTFAEKIIELFF